MANKFWVALVVSFAVSSGVTLWLLNANHDDNSLEGDVVSRLDAIQDRLDRLDQSVRKLEENTVTKRDLRERTMELVERDALSSLEKSLLARMKAIPQPSSKDGEVASKKPFERDPVAQAKIEEAKKKLTRRVMKEQEAKAIRNWVRKSTAPYARRLAKQINLTPDQTQRLTTALENQGMNAAPHFGTLKDESLSVEERLAAIDQIRAGDEAFSTEARNILSTSQYDDLMRIRSEDPKSPTRWIDNIEESLRGGSNAGSSNNSGGGK